MCDLTGRLVTGEGVGVRVPPAGQATSIHALEVDGEVVLQVRHETDGRVTGLLSVLGPENAPDQAGIITQDMVGGQAACSDRSFTSYGSKESDDRLWYYNSDTDPTVGSPAALYHERGVTSAVVNLLAGYNDCGLAGGFRASQTYLGNTTARSNISSDSTCNGLDGVNVVDWGSINNADHLGLTCRYDFLLDLPGYEEIIEADIKIGNKHSYLAALPTSACENSYDVMALMTHEWGHAFGLGHTPDPAADHRQQTMNPYLTACSTFQRTLGRGDWTGMNTVYGPR
ncbi:matrixin family metalloprotease [Blastococcus jejuensis]